MRQNSKSLPVGAFLNKTSSIKSWRIAGLVQYHKALVNKVIEQPGEKSAGDFLNSAQDYLGQVENILHRHHLSVRDLSHSNQAAYLNISGIVDIHRSGTSRYSQIYTAVLQVMNDYPRLKGRRLLLTVTASGRLSHQVKVFKNYVDFHVSLASIDMETEYFTLLATLLFSRVLKKNVKRELQQKLSVFENRFLKTRPPVPAKAGNICSPRGKYYNLTDIFNRINHEYFNNGLKIPILGWTRKPATRRLGYYDYTQNRLIVSSFLDNDIFPDYIIQGIVYHEMLHMIHPVRHKNGRRIVHSREFKDDEKKFRYYAAYEKWFRHEYPRYLRNKRKPLSLKRMF
jgi:hypothetical protein